MDIFRKKDVSKSRTGMKRHLKIHDLILLGIGAMVGTGIFTITGIGAANYAGPSLIISIIISALCVSMSALFYAEFASRIPANGGAYSYIYAVFGEFPAWIAGWLTIMEFMTAISGVASGWGSYLKGLLSGFGIQLPTALNGTFNPKEGTYVDLLPILVLLFVTAVVLLNSKAALRFNSALVVLKFSALALFVIAGLFFIKPENWSNFAPFGFGEIYGGKVGIMAGASLMFFAFLGFESISMAVDEIKEPQKNVPRGIVLSLTIVTILYILVTFALSRMIYSIARDGLLPRSFRQLTETSRVPKNATILVGIASAVCAGIFPLASIASFLNICTLAYLILLALAILKLRKDKGMPQAGEFKTPFVPVLPFLSIIICLSFMTQYTRETWQAFGIALLVGSLIYFAYGYKHSEIYADH
ncbi:amino acid permease [Streptococcus gordonii]|uniref:amino acid permease n=1 Tax=Streptococcus gordonii TaxID=1302 RepID=UPI00189B3D04|nr:amino acid permease [Streptococcus gordonii]